MRGAGLMSASMPGRACAVAVGSGSCRGSVWRGGGWMRSSRGRGPEGWRARFREGWIGRSGWCEEV